MPSSFCPHARVNFHALGNFLQPFYQRSTNSNIRFSDGFVLRSHTHNFLHSTFHLLGVVPNKSFYLNHSWMPPHRKGVVTSGAFFSLFALSLMFFYIVFSFYLKTVCSTPYILFFSPDLCLLLVLMLLPSESFHSPYRDNATTQFKQAKILVL